MGLCEAAGQFVLFGQGAPPPTLLGAQCVDHFRYTVPTEPVRQVCPRSTWNIQDSRFLDLAFPACVSEGKSLTRILAIANQKGGVGKTTTAVNLSASLAAGEQRTLLVDLDPQGNAGSGLGVAKGSESSMYDVLIGDQSLSRVRRSTELKFLDLAPAHRDLVGAEIELVQMARREFRLRDALTEIASEYDYILIDCPPSLGLLTLNALSAAQSVLIPLQSEYYALEGLTEPHLGPGRSLFVPSSIPSSSSRASSSPCSIRATTWRTRWPPTCDASLAARSSRRSSRAMSGCRKALAMASRFCSMISSRAAVRSIWPSPRVSLELPPHGQSDLRMSEVDPRPRRPALGRGLAALIPSAPIPAREGVLLLDLDRVAPDPDQPRHYFEPTALDELAQSIREQGILQPVLVRRSQAGFVLVAGERRWRAAQRAGLQQIPALVKDLSAAEAFTVALVENLQRQDLTPLEEAEGYRRLLEDHGMTQEDLAKRLGRDRSTIANTMRLLKLPGEEVRAEVATGRLSMGHARALLGAETPEAMIQLAREILRARGSRCGKPRSGFAQDAALRRRRRLR